MTQIVLPAAPGAGAVTGVLSAGYPAEPVAFGSHPKTEAILFPYEVYERYEELSRQHAGLDSALDAAQSVQVELPGPFRPP